VEDNGGGANGRAGGMRGLDISGFTPEDADFVRGSAEHLGPAVPTVLDALYDHLLSMPETAKFFEGQDIQHRKEALVAWLMRTIEGPHDARYWSYLERVGRIHKDYGVPAYQIVHLIGWVQGTLSAALLASDRPEKTVEAAAWTKLLTAQLDPMLSPYRAPEPA
jgi:hypothetical protein